MWWDVGVRNGTDNKRVPTVRQSQDHESFGLYTSGPSYLVTRVGPNHYRVDTVNGIGNETYTGDRWRLEAGPLGVGFELYQERRLVFSTEVTGETGLDKYLRQTS
jgi:hypothetical protein